MLEKLTECLFISMSWGGLFCHFEVYIRKVHSYRLASKILKEFTQEFECHSIIFFESFIISCFWFEFGRIEGVHIARNPEVSLEFEVKLGSCSKFLSYWMMKLIKKLWLAYFVTEYNTIFWVHVVNSFRVIFISGSTYESYVLLQICASQLFKHKLKFSVVFLLVHKLKTGLEFKCAEILRRHSVFVYVNFGINPESFGTWFDRFQGLSWAQCLAVVSSKDDGIVSVL